MRPRFQAAHGWILVALILTVLATSTGLLDAIEWRTLDARYRIRPRGEWPEYLVAVVVDDEAKSRFGDWPWDAETLATLLRRLESAGTKTAGLVMAALDSKGEALAFRDIRMPVVAATVVAPRAGQADNPALERSRMTPTISGERLFLPAAHFEHLLTPSYAPTSWTFGHLNDHVDPAGALRTEPFHAADGGGHVLPSFALAAMARHHDWAPSDIVIDRAGITLPGRTAIPFYGGSAGILLDAAGRNAPLREVRAIDLLDPDSGGVPDGMLRGRLAVVFDVNDPRQLIIPGIGAATEGTFALFSIRTLEFGRLPRIVPQAPVLLALLALVLAATRSMIRRTAVRSIAISAAAVAVYCGAAAALVPLADVFVPVGPSVLFLSLSAIALGAASGARAQKLYEHAASRADAAIAPKGRIALVFTDVKGSTRLWEAYPTAMREALSIHNELLRSKLVLYGGYEVKTEGDAFMLSFADPVDALRWCLDVQISLLEQEWPPEILRTEDAGEVSAPDGRRVYRGIRVRMGIHLGEPECVPDPKTGRMDYFGPVVNRAARVSGQAAGGQILVSGDAWAAIEPALPQLGPLHVRDTGLHPLKGIDAPERLVEVLPAFLKTRAGDLAGTGSRKIPMVDET